MTVIEILKHCRLFELLDDEELERVAAVVEEHHFRKGEYICKEGAWGDSMYIIGDGEVKIAKKLDVESVWDITSLRHGDFFGEVALVDGSQRTASGVGRRLGHAVGAGQVAVKVGVQPQLVQGNRCLWFKHDRTPPHQ